MPEDWQHFISLSTAFPARWKQPDRAPSAVSSSRWQVLFIADRFDYIPNRLNYGAGLEEMNLMSGVRYYGVPGVGRKPSQAFMNILEFLA
jgi:hypothetical protein